MVNINSFRYRMIHAKFGEGVKMRITLFEVWDILGIEVHQTKKGGNASEREKYLAEILEVDALT